MRKRRLALVGVPAILTVVALVAPAPAVVLPIFPGSERGRDANQPTSQGRGRSLAFAKPVALNSASPVRTLVGNSPAYGGSDHEWSGEPVIKVDSQGVVFIAGTCCIVASSPVWLSRDGREFEEVETPAHAREWSIGAEGDLAIDDEDRVYFIDTYVPGLVLTRWSSDEAAPVWDYTVPANAGIPPGSNDRPWLAWSKQGLYLYINHITHVAIYRSTDGGLTWIGSPPLSWDGSLARQQFWPGHIAADRENGTLYVSGRVGDGRTLGSAVSEDGGQTFRNSAILEVPKGRSLSQIFTGSTAVDKAGNAYVTWSLSDDSGKKPRSCDVYFASTTNKGETWSKPVKVSRAPGCATFPWISARGRGKVALTWYQTPEVLPGTSAGASPQDAMPPEAEWFVHAAAVTEATGKSPKVKETRIKTETPVAKGPLGRQLWDFLQVDIGPRGDIHITFAEKYEDDAPQTWYTRSLRSPKLR
jgi:hypothetical protein